MIRIVKNYIIYLSIEQNKVIGDINLEYLLKNKTCAQTHCRN